MKNKKIFEESDLLSGQIKEEQKKLIDLESKRSDLMKKCKHELVFSINDDHPRLAVLYGKYFCPACGKIKRYLYQNERALSCFSNSRVIDMTDLSLILDNEIINLIRKEVFENIDLYYNPGVPEEQLHLRMVDLLKDKQYSFKTKKKELIKKLGEKND